MMKCFPQTPRRSGTESGKQIKFQMSDTLDVLFQL